MYIYQDLIIITIKNFEKTMTKMKRLFITFTALIILAFPKSLQAFSLDEVYRDVVRSAHDGYLPTYIKNRNSPTLDFGTSKLSEVKDLEEAEEMEVLSFNKSNKEKTEAMLRDEESWKKTLIAVQENQVTPTVIDEIEKIVALDDPKAVEIYAWMFAKGAGVQKDLIKAFDLYKKAIALGVDKADENAVKVFNVMTREQKERVIY